MHVFKQFSEEDKGAKFLSKLKILPLTTQFAFLNSTLTEKKLNLPEYWKCWHSSPHNPVTLN